MSNFNFNLFATRLRGLQTDSWLKHVLNVTFSSRQKSASTAQQEMEESTVGN